MSSNEQLDEIADSYHSAPPPDIHIENACQEYEVAWLLEALSGRQSILDLGIGDGLILGYLIDFAQASGAQFTCIEGSGSLVTRFSNLNSSSISIQESLFEEFQAKDTYDVIVASHILEHVEDPVVLLNHLSRFMRPDALIVGIVPNRESIHRRLAVSMGIQPELDTLSPRDHVVGHRRVYSLATLESDLESAGFEIVAHRGFFLKTLSNGQMLQYEPELLNALLEVSDNLPTQVCANIGFIARKCGSNV